VVYYSKYSKDAPSHIATSAPSIEAGKLGKEVRSLSLFSERQQKNIKEAAETLNDFYTSRIVNRRSDKFFLRGRHQFQSSLQIPDGRDFAGAQRSAKRGFKEPAIYVTEDTTKSVLLHEFVHTLEYQDIRVQQRSVEFVLSRRAPNETAKKMSQLTGNPNYRAYEIAIEDLFKTRNGHHYSGKLYYRGSDMFSIPNHYASEALTMGAERLLADPVRFMHDDYGYFQFVVGTLQGWL
jgi:hypothetical protein